MKFLFWIHSYICCENLKRKKVHNMFTLMLGLWYKNMPLICSFIGHDFNNLVINEYIRGHWSQCLWNGMKQSIKMDFTTECHLDIFQMGSYDNEPLCKCVNWKLLFW
jgi:hypothetical protein